MLANASVTTMLPVVEMDRARAFYEQCLGLTPSGFKPDGKFIYQVGGSTLALSATAARAQVTTTGDLLPYFAPLVGRADLGQQWPVVLALAGWGAIAHGAAGFAAVLAACRLRSSAACR